MVSSKRTNVLKFNKKFLMRRNEIKSILKMKTLFYATKEIVF